MKQKLFNIMVTVCMLLTLLPLSATTIHGVDLVSVTFEGTTNNYASFEDAWAAAVAIDETDGTPDVQSSESKPITIKLLADVTATSAVSNTYRSYLNLDTNGHTLTFSGNASSSRISITSATLNILGTGTITGSVSGSSRGIVESDYNSSLYIYNATITNTDVGECIYVNDGSLKLYNGVLNSNGVCIRLTQNAGSVYIHLYGGKLTGNASSLIMCGGAHVVIHSTLASGLVFINKGTASIVSDSIYMSISSNDVDSVVINYGSDITGGPTTSTTDKTWSNVNSNKYVKVVALNKAAVAPTIRTNLTETADNYYTTDTATALSITASASGTLSYQWYKNTSNSTSGGTAISGATSSSYTPDISTAGTSNITVW